jgi:transposase InsO family protein
LQREVVTVVKKTKERTRWSVRKILRGLEVSPASYYRWPRQAGRGGGGGASASSPGSLFEVLPAERQAIVDYAKKHPEVRHRELAWKMVDDGVCAVSASTVYRVLLEANLVCRWKPWEKKKGTGQPEAPTKPNQRWETDLRYVDVNGRKYYLISFLDVYSRYVVHHELLRWMDATSVSTALVTALAPLKTGPRPTVQSDHGPCFIAREFAETLREMKASHRLIRPHTPTDNAHVERYHRTIGEKIDEELAGMEEADVAAARTVIGGVIEHYNHHRLHSSLNYLRPVDYHEGDPETLLAERRRKLQAARELRKQENLKLRQRRLPFPAGETVTYSTRRVVSV